MYEWYVLGVRAWYVAVKNEWRWSDRIIKFLVVDRILNSDSLSQVLPAYVRLAYRNLRCYNLAGL